MFSRVLAHCILTAQTTSCTSTNSSPPKQKHHPTHHYITALHDSTQLRRDRLSVNPHLLERNHKERPRTMAPTLYPRGTLKKIIKAHSNRAVSKNVDILVGHLRYSVMHCVFFSKTLYLGTLAERNKQHWLTNRYIDLFELRTFHARVCFVVTLPLILITIHHKGFSEF